MSETTEPCPKCGMAQTGPIHEGYRHWDCGSFGHASGACHQPSKACSALAESERKETAATKERDELLCAIWVLDEPDDATHQETLDHIEVLWKSSTRPVSLLLDQTREIAAATDEVKRLREAVEKVRANAYLDDNVINRHPFTTVSCEALRGLFSALLAPEPAEGRGDE